MWCIDPGWFVVAFLAGMLVREIILFLFERR